MYFELNFKNHYCFVGITCIFFVICDILIYHAKVISKIVPGRVGAAARGPRSCGRASPTTHAPETEQYHTRALYTM